MGEEVKTVLDYDSAQYPVLLSACHNHSSSQVLHTHDKLMTTEHEDALLGEGQGAGDLLDNLEDALKGTFKGSNLLNVWRRLCEGHEQQNCFVADYFVRVTQKVHQLHNPHRRGQNRLQCAEQTISLSNAVLGLATFMRSNSGTAEAVAQLRKQA